MESLFEGIQADQPKRRPGAPGTAARDASQHPNAAPPTAEVPVPPETVPVPPGPGLSVGAEPAPGVTEPPTWSEPRERMERWPPQPEDVPAGPAAAAPPERRQRGEMRRARRATRPALAVIITAAAGKLLPSVRFLWEVLSRMPREEDGTVNASQSALMERTGCSRTTIKRNLRLLSEVGLIDVIDRGIRGWHFSARYRVGAVDPIPHASAVAPTDESPR